MLNYNDDFNLLLLDHNSVYVMLDVEDKDLNLYSRCVFDIKDKSHKKQIPVPRDGWLVPKIVLTHNSTIEDQIDSWKYFKQLIAPCKDKDRIRDCKILTPFTLCGGKVISKELSYRTLGMLDQLKMEAEQIRLGLDSGGLDGVY